MTRLLILRHAEAVPKDEGDDFDRVLSARGRDQMAAMARHLRGLGRPDLALVSPAARTRETWSRAGLETVPARYDDRIYEADVETLLAVVRDVDASAETVILIGHNPGLHELAHGLVGRDRPAALRRLADFPTACLATLDFDGPGWRDAAFRSGSLAAFVTPDTATG